MVRDTETDVEFEVPNAGLLFRSTLSIEQQRRYTILAVEVRPTIDELCERVALDVVSYAAARVVVSEASLVRVLFVDAHNALAFIWKRGNYEAVRHSTAIVPPWAAVSLLPSSVTAYLDRRRWQCITTLQRANDFAPTPPLLAQPFMLLYINYEVFVRIRMDAATLLRLCNALKAYHAKYGGRCEIRFGASKAFFDVAALRASHFPRRFFGTLARVLGSRTLVTLHKGKAQVPVAPLQLRID